MIHTVQFDPETGRILSTFSGPPKMAPEGDDWVRVSEPIEDPGCWRIEGSALVPITKIMQPDEVRREAIQRLSDTDFRLAADVAEEAGPIVTAAWKDYRKRLRQIMKSFTQPGPAPDWPDEP